MKKAVATNKGKTSKPAKKKASHKPKKPADLVEVRKEIAAIVTESAHELTKAVIEEGRKGQLAPVKYLFEVAGLYPATDEGQAKPEGESLAKTLLHRLGLPDDPVIKQEDEESPSQLSLPAHGANNESEKVEETEGSHLDSEENQSGDKRSVAGHAVPVRADSIP